jgi:hypothetical protein
MTADNAEGFDPARPPVIVYRVLDSERPETVCSWRWWGPLPGWDVFGWIVRVGDKLVLERVSIVPHGSYEDDWEDDTGEATSATTSLPTSLMRQIPLSRLMAQVRVDLVRRAATAPAREQWAQHVLAVAGSLEDEPIRGPGRAALSDDLLFDVAVAYLEEAEHGRGVWGRMATRLGQPEARVRELIRAARKRGYLSDAEPGKRDAQAGPRMLAEMHDGETGREGTQFEHSSAAERDAAWDTARRRPYRSDEQQPPF